MTFACITTHRGIWPTEWLCAALGVSRAGFYAWRIRLLSARARANDQLRTRVRASFQASDRTYGARRVWHDLLADEVSCGRHRIERLMRQAALRARPRRRQMPSDTGVRSTHAIAPNVLDRTFTSRRPIANGSPTSPISRPPKAGSTSRRWWISSRAGSSAGPCRRR